MYGEDLAALHQMRKSKRGGDADTPGVELNLRVCSCTGLLRASLPRSFINDNEGDGQIIRSQSLSLFLSLFLLVSPSHLIAISVSLSLCHNLFFSPSFLPPFSYPSLPSASLLSLFQHILSVLHFLADLRHMIRRL